MSTELPTNPQNRNEQFLNAIADSSAELPANPQNRREKYLNAIAQKDASLAPAHAYNREEQYLAYIAEHPGSGGETETKTVTITENGTTEVTPTEGKTMSKVTVTTAVPVPTLEASKSATFTENGTFTIEPSEGKDAIEEVSVTVNVPNPLLAHTVTVVRDGVTKYVLSVADGESIQALPTPSESGSAFFGWWTTSTMIGGTKISFPYTPTADITIYEIVTTLAGATYLINNLQTPFNNYGIFNVNYTISSNEVSFTPDGNMISLGIGFSVSKVTGTNTYQIEAKERATVTIIKDECFYSNTQISKYIEAGTIKLGNYADAITYTSSSRNIFLQFISGDDIANQSLVNWLTTYATRTA